MFWFNIGNMRECLLEQVVLKQGNGSHVRKHLVLLHLLVKCHLVVKHRTHDVIFARAMCAMRAVLAVSCLFLTTHNNTCHVLHDAHVVGYLVARGRDTRIFEVSKQIPFKTEGLYLVAAKHAVMILILIHHDDTRTVPHMPVLLHKVRGGHIKPEKVFELVYGITPLVDRYVHADDRCACCERCAHLVLHN